jgi:signal transduction histidine kinase
MNIYVLDPVMDKKLGNNQTLNQIASVVSQSLDLDKILCTSLDMILQATELEIGCICLIEENSGMLSIVASVGFTDELEEKFGQLMQSNQCLSEVVESGKPLIINDITLDNQAKMVGFDPGDFSSIAVVPLHSKRKIVGTVALISQDPKDFNPEEVQLLISGGRQIGVAVENASLYQAQQKRAEQFKVIAEVGRQITSIMDIDELLNQVVRLIQQSFGYDHVAIATIEDEYAVYRVGAGRLWDDPNFDFNPSRLKIGDEGVTGRVAASGELLYLPDVRLDPGYVEMKGSGTLSELAVPVKVKGKVVGVLDAQSERLNAFDESDQVVLQSLADQAAVAIENAQLYKQAQQLAVIEERNRLARELHDSVTQALYGITLHAEAAFRQLKAGQESFANEQLTELRNTAQEALREMRLLIFELRPSVVELQGLVPALRARVEAVEERAGIGVEVDLDESLDLSEKVQDGLYRIAQEALNNALKHAKANHIKLNLSGTKDKVILKIVDDGVGFEPEEAIEGGGLGLDGIIERAELLGGKLRIDSLPDTGTTIRVEVPYE